MSGVQDTLQLSSFRIYPASTTLGNFAQAEADEWGNQERSEHDCPDDDCLHDNVLQRTGRW